MTTLIFPWRDTNPDRARAKDTVVAAVTGLLPDAEVIFADSGHQPFNRAASRNHGVRQAGDGVVVVCDADTIPERQPLHEAIAAAEDGMLHLPYITYRALTRLGTRAHLLLGRPLQDCATELVRPGSQGGVLVMQAEAWFEAGGMDERFTGWGFEDAAFYAAAATLLGEPVRHEGTIYHLWHPTELNMGSATYIANAGLCRLYERAYGDPEAVRALQEGEAG